MSDLKYNHGSAERIPPAGEPLGGLASWMGSRAKLEWTEAGEVEVIPAIGEPLIAKPGDWLIANMAGEVFVGSVA